MPTHCFCEKPRFNLVGVLAKLDPYRLELWRQYASPDVSSERKKQLSVVFPRRWLPFAPDDKDVERPIASASENVDIAESMNDPVWSGAIEDDFQRSDLGAPYHLRTILLVSDFDETSHAQFDTMMDRLCEQFQEKRYSRLLSILRRIWLDLLFVVLPVLLFVEVLSCFFWSLLLVGASCFLSTLLGC